MYGSSGCTRDCFVVVLERCVSEVGVGWEGWVAGSGGCYVLASEGASSRAGGGDCAMVVVW